MASLSADASAKVQELTDAAMVGDDSTVTRLIEESVDVNARNQYGQTALQAACSEGHPMTTRLLIRHGAKVNETDMYGMTALHYACSVNRPGINGRWAEIAEIVISAGASLEAVDQTGRTPLLQAAQMGNPEVVDVLINAGANLRATVTGSLETGTTVLHWAARGGFLNLGAAFLSKCPDLLEMTNCDGETALHTAARKGQTAFVERLLSLGAAIDAQEKQQRTALTLAVQKNHREMVELLISKGADINGLACGGDNTPLSEADMFGFADIAALLREKGAT